MTVIRPNSISGVTSITAHTQSIEFYKSDGTLSGANLDGVNINTAGILTAANFKNASTNVHSIGIDIGSNIKIGSGGIITATSYRGDGSQLTGIAGGVTSDAQGNTVGGTNSGDSFSGTDAIRNTLYGFDTGTAITNADRTTAVGYHALKTVSTNNFNSAFGDSSLRETTGQRNNAFGNSAGIEVTSGSNNCFFGSESGAYCGSSSQNTGVGNDSLYRVGLGGEGNYNTGVGYRALYDVRAGDSNTSLGYKAGDNINGSNNIVIGANADASSSSVSNEITLGDGNIDHLRVPGIGCSISAGGAVISGVVTATSFSGSGANLTNLPAARSYRNLIINGAMTIAQRGTSDTVSGMKTVDRWTNNWSGGGVTQSQVSEQTGTVFENGFSNYLRLTNTSNTTTDTDYRFIGQTIEAQNVANSGWNFKSSSSYVTLTAWVRSSLAGTYYGWLNSRDGSGHTYTFSYTLSANTWTKITKTIPGNSNVTIHNNNEEGLVVHFIPWYGTYYTTSGHTLNTWITQDSTNRCPDFGQNWANTSNATFDVTGVQLEVGSSATTFEHRSVADELARCQRYYYVHCSDNYETLGVGLQYYSGYIFIAHNFPVTMRSEPTLEAVSGTSGAYVYEKLFGNSPEYTHQISQDTGKTGHNQVILEMLGTASRHGQAVRCSAHSIASNLKHKFVAYSAEI